MKEYAVTVDGKDGAWLVDVWCMNEQEATAFWKPPQAARKKLYTASADVNHVHKRIPEILVYWPTAQPTMLTYILQVSANKPTRFRISVVEFSHETKHELADTIDTPDFKTLGVYETADKVMEAITPYLKMEEGS